MGSKTKEEQNRVKTLLSDTVTLLCKNGLSFKKNLKVQGLLGITVDDDEVFIVHLDETLGDLVSASDLDQTPTKSSESVRRTPNRKRRRRSTDSNTSNKSPRRTEERDCIIDLDPDIDIKMEPDTMVLDEVKYEGTQRQSCDFGDEGLDHAIGSISSLTPSFSGSGDTIGGQALRRQTMDSFNSFNTSANNTDPVSTSTSQPYVTGLIPNVADTSNQSSASGSFQWDSNTAQSQSSISNWASQVTQQTMSQQLDMSQQPGPSQGFSPGQRTGTVASKSSSPSKGLFSKVMSVSDRICRAIMNLRSPIVFPRDIQKHVRGIKVDYIKAELERLSTNGKGAFFKRGEIPGFNKDCFLRPHPDILSPSDPLLEDTTTMDYTARFHDYSGLSDADKAAVASHHPQLQLLKVTLVDSPLREDRTTVNMSDNQITNVTDVTNIKYVGDYS